MEDVEVEVEEVMDEEEEAVRKRRREEEDAQARRTQCARVVEHTCVDSMVGLIVCCFPPPK